MAKRTPGIGDKWIRVCRLLNSRDVKYIVVGSVAMALHGATRATKDIDVLVPRDAENMKRLLEALEELPMGLTRELDAEFETRKQITIIGDDPRVDVLKGAGGLSYKDAERSKRTTTVDGVEVPYVELADLIKSKQTDRDEDRTDLRTLKRLEAQQERDQRPQQPVSRHRTAR